MGALARRRGSGPGRFVSLRALLFDVDGTLIDSDPIHTAVFIDFLAERGVTITEADYIEKIHGRQNVAIFGQFLPEADPVEMDLAKEAAYRARLGDTHDPMPGIHAILDWAEATGLKLGVVTNGPRANLEAAISATGLGGRFGYLGAAEDVEHGKPHPAPYLRALDRLGVAAHEALVFEDSPSGIAAARAAGIPVVALATSLPPERLVALGAEFAIPDFTDPALLRHLALPEGKVA